MDVAGRRERPSAPRSRPHDRSALPERCCRRMGDATRRHRSSGWRHRVSRTETQHAGRGIDLDDPAGGGVRRSDRRDVRLLPTVVHAVGGHAPARRRHGSTRSLDLGATGARDRREHDADRAPSWRRVRRRVRRICPGLGARNRRDPPGRDPARSRLAGRSSGRRCRAVGLRPPSGCGPNRRGPRTHGPLRPAAACRRPTGATTRLHEADPTRSGRHDRPAVDDDRDRCTDAGECGRCARHVPVLA